MHNKTARFLSLIVIAVFAGSGCVHHQPRSQMVTQACYKSKLGSSGKLGSKYKSKCRRITAAELQRYLNAPRSQHYAVAKFNRLDVAGRVILIIKKGPKQSVMALGNSASLAFVHPFVVDHTLHIGLSVPKNYAYKPVTLEVTTPNLFALRINSCANVLMFGQLNIFKVTINDMLNCPMNIRGQLFANHLRIDKRSLSPLNISWLQGNVVRINSMIGDMHLAGSVDHLVMYAVGKSHVDARYLRVNNADITTHNHARVDTSVINQLVARAYNNSNIFYYKQPQHLRSYGGNSGNVLQLANWR